MSAAMFASVKEMRAKIVELEARIVALEASKPVLLPVPKGQEPLHLNKRAS